MDHCCKEDWEDQKIRNKSKGMCGKHKRDNQRSEAEMGNIFGETYR